MNAYLAFVRKEFTESRRTWRLFLLMTVFLLFGFMNPVVAKVTPDLLKALMPAGMSITLPEPSAIDSWAQFFKNASQVGLIVLAVVYSGIMATEFTSGTLINLLTKGLSRATVILAKLTTAIAVWTLAYVVCFGVTWVYTLYFWRDSASLDLFLPVFGLWLFGVLLLVLLVLGGILFKSTIGSLLLTGGVALILSLLNIAPKLQKYNPVTLSASNVELITGKLQVGDFMPAIIICAIAIVAGTATAILALDHRQI